MASIGDFLFGEKEKTERVSVLSPQQQQFQKQIFQLLGMGGEGGEGGAGQGGSPLDFLRDLLDPESAGASGIADQARRQFETRTAPQIAERFAGAGALSSSGFGQALGSGAADLESQLASLGSERQMGGLKGILDLLTGAAGRDEFAIKEKSATSGFLPQLLGSAARSFIT
tara:strand:+ start:227 stop:739 length:513 start_codon:yes stop_codon:yes gene_type:complete